MVVMAVATVTKAEGLILTLATTQVTTMERDITITHPAIMAMGTLPPHLATLTAIYTIRPGIILRHPVSTAATHTMSW